MKARGLLAGHHRNGELKAKIYNPLRPGALQQRIAVDTGEGMRLCVIFEGYIGWQRGCVGLLQSSILTIVVSNLFCKTALPVCPHVSESTSQQHSREITLTYGTNIS